MGYIRWKGWIDGIIMKHIQLLTMESYLETKKEVIENAGYVLKELHIDHGERVREVIDEIIEEYFGEGREYVSPNSVLIDVWKKDDFFELSVDGTTYSGKDIFLENLKTKYSQLIKEKQYKKIVEDIEKTLSKVFIDNCALLDSHMKKVYEIIKYTLSGEVRCDYLDNGKFINEMKEEAEDIFPFEKENDTLPIFCQDMQRILFGVHRKIFANPNDCTQSLDITRFSFYNTRKIVDAVTKSLKIKEDSKDYKEDSEDYNNGYIEGVEDYILLDDILGISLTNIIYYKTKEIKEREVQDNIIEIVSYLAKCRSSTGRNSVTQVLLDHLKATDYNENIIREVREILKKKIKAWNEYYEEVESVVLCPLFSYLNKCSPNDLIEICKSTEYKNTWGEYIYMDEIAESMGEGHKEESKIRIPKKGMDSRTWYAYIHKTVFDVTWS